MSAPKPRVFLKGLVLIATLVAITYLFEISHLRSMLDEAWVDAEVRGKGVSGELLFLAVGMVATGIGLPRQIVSFLAGYAFGLPLGTALGLVATVGGCIATFAFARWFGRNLVAARSSRRVRRVDNFIRENTFSMTLLIRLLPAGSNLVTSLAAGVSNVRPLPFFLGSAVGFVPQTLVFALIGSGIGIDPTLRIGLGVVLFVVSGFLGVYLFRRFRHGRHLDRQFEEDMGVAD